MSETKKFMVGFGMKIFTPEDSVPMASYGDDLRRFSEGKFSELEARAIAVTDENDDTLIFITGDLSWCPSYLGGIIKANLVTALGIREDHIILSGLHTHASVATRHDHLPEVFKFNEQYVTAMTRAAKEAMADRKPAEIYVGSAITERMNFVRRYIMDDGSFCGDNAYGTGTIVVAHESQADPELQLMRIVRDGGKDIIVANFQGHPHLEGKTKMLSYQLGGFLRAELERRLDVHALYWNGGAGNINSASRIKQENRTKVPEEWASIMADYVEKALPHMYKVKTGPIQVKDVTYTARVNHNYDPIADKAKQVQQYFKDGHTAKETAEYAWQFGINSYYHANRIIANANAPATQNVYLLAFSFGDIGGVVLPYEMFDTTCMFIKRNSPLRRTFIVGYSYPANCGYIPSEFGFKSGGYEADNCTFAPGTAEEFAEQYLKLLNQMCL